MVIERSLGGGGDPYEQPTETKTLNKNYIQNGGKTQVLQFFSFGSVILSQ